MGKDNFNCPSLLADVNLTTIHHMAMTFFHKHWQEAKYIALKSVIAT